ncbi:TRMT1-like protein [Cloeon dipterum]|uniref:TRMT1-like protein n=1 Tax=Cloeon dipterum TaxID=197152 RepID=UPI0032201592
MTDFDSTFGVRIGKNPRKTNEFPTKEVSEYGVKLLVDGGSINPKQSACHYDYQLSLTRALVATSIAAFDKSGLEERKMQCLEAFPSTGASGLLWAKHLSSEVTKFHLNCSYEPSVMERVQENIKINDLGDKVQVLNFDPFSINNDHSFFNFVYLEGFANSSQYLDNIFKRIPRRGMVAISTVDDPAIYCKSPEVAQRHYGGLIGKTLYYKELAARLIVAAAARSAARSNRGIRVMWVYNFKSSISMLLQVDKGPAKANESLKNTRSLIHCNICEERAFYPDTNYVIENPYSLLACSCKSKMPGKTAINIGPVWSGELFDANFLQKMVSECSAFPWKSEAGEILSQLLEEALCPETTPLTCAVSQSDGDDPPNKRVCVETAAPPFYYNLHHNRPKDSKMIKADKVVTFLRSNGFRASRTHFDREAVKTNASVAELLQIIRSGGLKAQE